MYIDKSDDKVNKYNNIYHKGPKFEIDDHVRISKYKNIFAKSYNPNWSEEVFVINEVKNTAL